MPAALAEGRPEPDDHARKRCPMTIPADLRYSKEHEWLALSEGRARVGITAFAQEQLGDVVYVEVPAVGQSVRAGKAFGVVESVKAVSDLYSPISGTIVAVNEALVDAPEAVNSDPYGAGWMVEIEPADLAELDALLDAGAYAALIAGDGA